jgi:hypothetical protein
VTQHAGLGAERWAEFGLDQQILMIGNEMNRASRFVERADRDAARRGYERVLRLADLTVACRPRRALLRELLRWRDVVAGHYCDGATDPSRHRAALRALLQMRPAAARQIPHLAPRER